jgi:hypothetical protein
MVRRRRFSELDRRDSNENGVWTYGGGRDAAIWTTDRLRARFEA